MIPPPLPLYEKSAWNGWWTLLWVVTLLLVWQLTLTVGLTLGLFADSSFLNDLGNAEAVMKRIEEASLDGDIVGFSTFLTIFVICPGCWYLGKIRPHWKGWEYLGVKSVKWWHWPLWAGLTYGLGLLFGYLGPNLGVEEMDDSMVQMAESTDYAILLILGVVVAAPLVEEFIFRGVAFRGWRNSKMGLIGTLILTSFIWTSLHIQYPAVILWYLFFFGIIMGIAREITGNIWIPVWMHFVNNALATVEMLKISS